VANDYADDRGQFLEPDFILRRAAAYRAYYEHMPLERAMAPRGPDMRIFDAYAYGQLAQFHVLDDRQYRHVQACPSPKKGGGSTVVAHSQCTERHDPARSLLGWTQEKWLHERLDRSHARWNILAQQSIMAQVNQSGTAEPAFWTDAWDGYPQARRRLLDFLAARRPSNPLVIGGDVHAHWVCDLKPDFDRPDSPVVASEFCGTSISSQGWPEERVQRIRANNPHARFASSERRGYVVMELSRARCEATLRGIDDEKRLDTGIRTQARFVVEDGRPGPQRA
jgi:alkaline phosphatase D